jgi:hypothetical protein
MIKLNKSQLDNSTTFIGLVIGIIIALSTYGYLPQRESNCAIAILGALGGYLTNKAATARPTTEEVEDKAVHQQE